MLGNFSYHNPTKLYFGKDSIKKLSNEMNESINNVLLIYGGGSIKKNGIYDKAINILNEKNKNIIELAGVMPNPTTDKLEEGIKLARENNIDFILAIGGGSVCDYSKALSASIYCKEDPFEKYFIKQEKVNNEVIPIGCILTMVGTGSEMNTSSVITNPHSKLKIGRTFDAKLYPKFSILDPTYTYTLPKYQMVAGFYDIMCHILEQYLSGDDDNTSDYIMEGLLNSLIHSSLIAIKDPTNYEARSNIMWTATWALNTLVAKGKSTDWNVHMFGHAVGAYTNATHGMTLAAVSMAYYNYILEAGLHRFKRFAINVWNVNPENKSDIDIAKEGLEKMKKYMETLGLVMNITDLGVKPEMINDIARAVFPLDGGYKKLDKNSIIEILNNSL